MSMALHGNEIAQSTSRRGLVFLATYKGDGVTRLPYMNRSFISFAFGKRNDKRVYIEDFDLIATIDGDRLQRQGYAKFEDNVTTYSNLDGLYYWGTHAKANELEFTLSTDGIELKKLDDFLYWFRAGETKELILSEHPNRAILARVAEAPLLNLLPFESLVIVTISGMNYTTSTTLYKGDILLKFVMDEPYWYALENILGTKIQAADSTLIDTYDDTWIDANGNSVNIFASKDALKILYEDGIPLGSMFTENMLLGNGAYAKVKDDYISLTWNTDNITASTINWSDSSIKYACTSKADGTVLGRISAAIVDASGNGISSLPRGSYGYFYYCGNAPAYTIIKFTFTPVINDNGYVIKPLNGIAYPNGTKYNTLFVESVNKQELRFTTPSYLTGYNKAVLILRSSFGSSAYTPEDVRATLRDNIHHLYARAWAVHTVDWATNNKEWRTNITISDVITEMRKFLENNGAVAPLTVEFNSQTGEAKGIMSYRTATNTFTEDIEENVGDMLRSNHIIIKDRNYPNSTGKIAAWTSGNRLYSHRVYHNMTDVEISNLTIYYKNMYL